MSPRLEAALTLLAIGTALALLLRVLVEWDAVAGLLAVLLRPWL
jgi:hypothetical protein